MTYTSLRPAMHIEIIPKDDATIVRLSGDVTGDGDFSPLMTLTTKRVALDMEKVRRFNSMGVHNWLLVLRHLGEVCDEIFFDNVGDAFLDQFVLLPEFSKPGIIRSINLSYHCDRCGKTMVFHKQRDKDFPDGWLVHTDVVRCADCGAEAMVQVPLLNIPL